MYSGSKIFGQDKVYVKYDSTGRTTLDQSNNFQPNYSYRGVHYTHDQQKIKQNYFVAKQGFFFDRNFIITEADLQSLGDFNRGQKVVLRRLYDLYKSAPKTSYTSFFPDKNYIPQRKLSADPFAPSFANQIGLFPPQFFKSFFLTQNYERQGFYQMVINKDGRFQTGCVDDWVPVYEHTLQPIWGMDIDQGWQIILLKFWAKRNGGYSRVRNLPPFSFIESFTNSNWKYFNIQKQGPNFLANYSGRTRNGKFILKTKDTDKVFQAGLVPNSAGYQILDILQVGPPPTFNTNAQVITSKKNVNEVESHQNLYKSILKQDLSQTPVLRRAQSLANNQRRWAVTVRSTLTNKWAGSFSVLDNQINGKYSPNSQPLALERDFMMNESDFYNLFSNAYVASRRQTQKQYISDYFIFDVPSRNKNSIYLKFDIQRPGWFDFCIKQSEQNRITAKSTLYTDINNSSLKDGKRFLKLKFILVKVNSGNSPSEFTDPKFYPPKYDTYEIEYFHGYNRGDAKFLNVVPGTYILKIKPQTVDQSTRFIVNYASNSIIRMQKINPSKQQTSLILRQAMASLIGQMAKQYPEVDRKFEEIVFSNTFQNLGYGFVGVRSNRNCPYTLLIEVDPREVRNSGYKLKNQFKKHTEPFSVLVKPGQSSAIVLKKIPGVNYVWPPVGIQVLKEVKNQSTIYSQQGPGSSNLYGSNINQNPNIYGSNINQNPNIYGSNLNQNTNFTLNQIAGQIIQQNVQPQQYPQVIPRT